ncbi:MAG: serine protease [Microscillaceae bacterium]|nr:serine protease [Microscillaceae bacterium]
MDSEDKISLIEQYIQGELSGQVLFDFEIQLQLNADLRNEVEEYRQLLTDFAGYHQRQSLKDSFALFHEEMDQEQNLTVLKPSYNKSKSLLIRILPAFAVAATVALIAAITAIFTLGNVRSLEEQQSNYYLELKKDLIEVKKAQNSLVQQNQKKTEVKPVKQYGATAFVISSNGYLVTNYHVVKKADSIYIEGYPEAPMRLKVEVVYNDVLKDLSILKITDTSFIGFAELPYTLRQGEAELGEQVYTLAYPRMDMVYGEGSISAKSGYRGSLMDTTLYQISIPVNPGNSGGPLMDERGYLVGIVAGKDTSKDGATFAVKTHYLKTLVDNLANTQNTDPIILSNQNKIQYLSRPEQIKLLKKFVFMVKVYDGK